MSNWIALLPAPSCENGGLNPLALGWWALQFTPRVALLEEAVVLEVQASERLFGGPDRLWQRLRNESHGLGVRAAAQAETALAALALARFTTVTSEPTSLNERLAPLPLRSLSAVGEHAETLQRMGCRTLGQVRALPRGGLSRRFGARLLHALDAAHGLRPEAFEWLSLPPVFDRRRELPWRLEDAEALHEAFDLLLHELCAWLAGQQAATERLHLHWCHDWARQDASRWQGHEVSLARPTADRRVLSRMVGEHLRRIELSAPVTDIGLRVDSLIRRESENASLFEGLDAASAGDMPPALSAAGQRAQHGALLELLDRLSIRLGPERVLAGALKADHRLGHSQDWLAAISRQVQFARPGSCEDKRLDTDAPQPTWVLPAPLPLPLSATAASMREAPVFQGRLTLLAGPHRIEAGWWDTAAEFPHEARDHHLASSPQAGLLWVFRERHAPQDGRSPWSLQGFFA